MTHHLVPSIVGILKHRCMAWMGVFYSSFATIPARSSKQPMCSSAARLSTSPLTFSRDPNNPLLSVCVLMPVDLGRKIWRIIQRGRNWRPFARRPPHFHFHAGRRGATQRRRGAVANRRPPDARCRSRSSAFHPSRFDGHSVRIHRDRNALMREALPG